MGTFDCSSGDLSDCWSPMDSSGVRRSDPIVASNKQRRPAIFRSVV